MTNDSVKQWIIWVPTWGLEFITDKGQELPEDVAIWHRPGKEVVVDANGFAKKV